MDINLGAGGRDIRKQAGKNLYTTGGGAGSFVLSAREFSRYSRGQSSAFPLSLSLSLSFSVHSFLSPRASVYL